jgi:UDPglucose--hexose-1-phosphate uridylyltransferase
MTMHPEFRFDALTRQWVGVAGSRQHRPNLPTADTCPFCVGGLEADGPYVVKAFPNRWPPMVPGTPLDFRDAAASSHLPARGAAEIVLYSPDHEASFATLDPSSAALVVDLWAERTSALLDRPEVEYVLVFENNGSDVGAAIPHPHGQIYAFPFMPPLPAREADVAERFGCPVCAELDAGDEQEARVVSRNDGFTTYTRYGAGWPFELLIAPTSHAPDLAALDPAGRSDFADALADALTRYRHVLDEPLPYMFWIHQGVHLHLHLVTTRRQAGTTRYVAAGELGSGTMCNPVLPEEAAGLLRAAAPARNGAARVNHG